MIDCKLVGERPVNAAGNITTDGVEVLGRMVRSRSQKDNSAPVRQPLSLSFCSFDFCFSLYFSFSLSLSNSKNPHNLCTYSSVSVCSMCVCVCMYQRLLALVCEYQSGCMSFDEICMWEMEEVGMNSKLETPGIPLWTFDLRKTLYALYFLFSVFVPLYHRGKEICCQIKLSLFPWIAKNWK